MKAWKITIIFDPTEFGSGDPQTKEEMERWLYDVVLVSGDKVSSIRRVEWREE